MTHPGPDELLALHFGELAGPRREACSAHARGCAACRGQLADLALVDEALGASLDAAPPAEGLERVLARIERLRPAKARRAGLLVAAGPSVAAALAFALAAQQGGPLAVLAFFAVGSIATLALAPVLILESKRRSA